jgi:hypothetical protein
MTELPPQIAAANAVASMRRPAELGLLAGLLGCYCLIYLLEASGLYSIMNLAGPTVLAAVLGYSCYRIARRSLIAIWAPLFWFRFASLAYFAFGALVPHLVNEETYGNMFRQYYFDEDINFKINVLYCFGTFSVLLFSFFFLGSNGVADVNAVAAKKGKESRRLLLFGLLFLVVGGVLRYGFLIPYNFGLTDGVLPGMFGSLAKTYYVGIYLLIVYAVRYQISFIMPVFLLFGLEVSVSIASFAKMDLLLILIFAFLGFLSSGISKTRILIGACCVLFAYFAFQPLVGYGRAELMTRYGTISGAGLQERWQIVESYLHGGDPTSASAHQGGLARLSYVNVAAFVIQRYDSGMPGNTLYNSAAVLVPRVLWPDKPIITQLGSDLYFLVAGRTTSALGVGHFAEAYWNFGWMGVMPFMAVLALILSVFSRVSMTIMARKDWLFIPVVFMGVDIGLRVDGHFVPDILGPCWIALMLGAGLLVFRSMFETLAGKNTRDIRPPA